METRRKNIRMKGNCRGREEGKPCWYLHSHANTHTHCSITVSHARIKHSPCWVMQWGIQAQTHTLYIYAIPNAWYTHTYSDHTVNMQHLLHAAHTHISLPLHPQIVWCPCCGELHIKTGTCCSHTHLHMHKNSKQSLLCSIPSRRTSAKIKPLWSKNTSQAREPKDWMEETTNTGEGGGDRGEEEEKGKKRGWERWWDLLASVLISFKIQSRESAGNVTLITFSHQ